jgi:hypothetical protein
MNYINHISKYVKAINKDKDIEICKIAKDKFLKCVYFSFGAPPILSAFAEMCTVHSKYLARGLEECQKLKMELHKNYFSFIVTLFNDNFHTSDFVSPDERMMVNNKSKGFEERQS